jgi:cytochrome b
VWDGATRLFHWLLVALVALSWWTAQERMMDVHRWSGSTIAGLLVFRIYWGFAGSRTARFSGFVKGPAAIGRYALSLLRSGYRASAGHNPLGGLSVLAMLAVLATHVGLGLFAEDTDAIASGPLARFVSYEASDAAADLHNFTFDVLLVLIGLHLSAVAFYLLVKRANLIGPMITGRRSPVPGDPDESLRRTPVWRLLLGIVLAVATTATLVIV